MDVISALGHIAKDFPDKIGLRSCKRLFGYVLGYSEKTFKAMDYGVDLLATYLFMHQVSRDKKVLIMLAPGEDLLMTVFAMLRLGAIPVIIDPGMGFRNFIKCARNTKPEIFIGGPGAWLIYRFLKSFVHFKSAVFLSPWLKDKLLKRNFVCRSIPKQDKNEIAAVLFTSGSTGHPKGAMYTYGEFNDQIDALKATFDIQPGEVDLPLLPVFSLYNPALGMTTIVPEMNPAHPSTLDPEKIARAIIKNKVTNSFGSPRLWTKIVDYCEKKSVVFPSVKRVFLAGAPVHPLLLKRVQALLPNGQAFTPYGATEALPVAYISAQEVLEDTYKKTLQGYGTCVGHAIDGVKIRIIPIVDGVLEQLPSELQPGEIGEIVVQASYISKQYLNDEAATAKAKIRDEQGFIWHRMGDLGYKDAQDRLWFCGRKIERVEAFCGVFYTDCCEAIFNAHEAVFRSALIAYRVGEEIVPAIVIESKEKLSAQEQVKLFNELRALAKRYKATEAIQHFCIYKNFPVDVRHNAKIHRLTLMRYFQKHPSKVSKI